MRILFITRKYPPSLGGMETFSAGFVAALGDQVQLMALRTHSQYHLVWWLPYTFFKALWMTRKVDVIHFGDGVLAGLGVVLHWLIGKPVTITVHGLDLTYRRFWYQRYVHWALPKLSAQVAVSTATAKLLSEQFALTATVITNGIDVTAWNLKSSMMNVTQLLFVGRLVPRKGCAWFVREVLPRLPNVTLTVIGEGEDAKHFPATSQVQRLGEASKETLQQAYGSAAALIMPNQIVANDVEGFGIVAIEAGACGLPVLASDLEGMRSAVIDGATGLLVESDNVEAWIQAIQRLQQALAEGRFQPQHIRQQVAERFGWQHIAPQYLKVFQSVIKK